MANYTKNVSQRLCKVIVLLVLFVGDVLFLCVKARALQKCEIGNYAAGKWVQVGFVTGNFSCVLGDKKYLYWDGALSAYFQTCQDRIDYYIPSQFPAGSVSCGIDKNPCGEPLTYLPPGQNCCVGGTGYFVWEWTDKSCDQNNEAIPNPDPGKPDCPQVPMN